MFMISEEIEITQEPSPVCETSLSDGPPLENFDGIVGNTIDISQVFPNSEPVICPVTCILKEQGCVNEYTGSEVDLSGELQVISIQEPVSTTVCLDCTNLVQNKQ
jgi:hypothetical protein